MATIFFENRPPFATFNLILGLSASIIRGGYLEFNQYEGNN